ncbi:MULTISPECIES: hypothetical protein [Rhodopirellula]|uniref:hypothetical protein n=1 Tax=Rhodopirellula TaxID=265488 RepID=UPI00257B64E5|nr:hypothetical protein [Rhodopirellula sp. UBA1907]
MSKRKFCLPGSDSPKAKINDPEKGCGQCDATDQKWSDWIAFAQVVRGDERMADAAEFVAGVIGHAVGRASKSSTFTAKDGDKTKGRSNAKTSKKAGGKVDLPKSLTLYPWSLINAAPFLERFGCPDVRAASDRLRDAGLQIGDLRHKVASSPDRWETARVLVYPVWGQGGSEAGPVNWIVERVDSQKLFAWSSGQPDPGNPRPKRKVIGGNSRGLIGDIRQIDSLLNGTLPARLSIKTEGISDWMTAVLRDDIPPDSFILTNPFGARDSRQSWEQERWSFDLFADRELWVIHDADAAGQVGSVGESHASGKVTPGWCQRFAEAGAQCRNVKLPFPTEKSHGPDLRDFFRGGGTFADLAERAAKSSLIQPLTDIENSEPSRKKIIWTTDEKKLVQSSIAALAKSPSIYQRGGKLFDVTTDDHPLNRDELTLQVRRLPTAHLRTELSSLAEFVVENEGGETRPKTLTDSLCKQIDKFASYPGVRKLDGVAEFPFLRPDGSVCSEPGYDSATRTYLETSLRVEVPDKPTRDDALRSAERLLDLVRDFEFKEEHHRSAWLAGLLTLFAKPAIRGCCPLFIFEASSAGSGKTRLVDLISTIATGRSMTRNPWPSKDEEVCKSVTSIVTSGIPMVLFDNCKTVLGGQSIEALGTAETWKARILGKSEETPEMPIRQTFFFSANNALVSSDIARRGCFVRLEPSVENPDLRDDFKYNDLLGHAAKHRAQLASDVFIILRAFLLSGAQPTIQRWGSFEAWSKLIRGSIEWLSLPDPIAGTISVKADTHASDVFPDLIAGLLEADLDEGSEIRAADIHELIQVHNGYGDYVHRRLRDAILSLLGDRKCTTRRIGMALKVFDGRILNGQKFSSSRNANNTTAWTIRPVGRRNSGTSGTSGGQSEILLNEYMGSATGASNPATTPNSSSRSGVPANCSPSCSESDQVEKKFGSEIKVVCGRCGRFFGRKKKLAERPEQEADDGAAKEKLFD